MLRSVKQSDLPAILAIELATQFAPWSEEIFMRCFSSGYKCWVKEDESQVVGFIVMSSNPLGESHILNICVTPQYQRKGIGMELMTHALSQARRDGIGTVFLEVRRSNKQAIALYHKLGFSEISERKNYYPSHNGREDALVFALDIGI